MMNMIMLAVVVRSSAVAWFLARRRLVARPLAEAVHMLVDCIGTCVLFFACNLVAGALTILLIRGVTSAFVSSYSLDIMTLFILSVGQGFVFRFLWRQGQ